MGEKMFVISGDGVSQERECTACFSSTELVMRLRIGRQEQQVAFISLVLATSHHSLTYLSLYSFTLSTRVLNLLMDFL